MKYQTTLISGLIAGLSFAFAYFPTGFSVAFANEPASRLGDEPTREPASHPHAVFAQTDLAQTDLAQIDLAQIEPPEIFIEPMPPREREGDALNLTPEVIEKSPVLQRWIREVPDIRDDIRSDPSFVTRLYAGYSFFPSSDSTSGLAVGIEDWFIASIPLTLSADYQQNFDSNLTNRRQAYGADLHYYLLPLGDYFNVAPIVGYRYAESGRDYEVSGANIGFRLRLVTSRTGAADVTLDQSWVVGDSEGLSITHFNVGYAVTRDLRLSTDLEWQRTADEGDSRVGINLEWSL